MTDFEKQVLSDLSELKTEMRLLIGNGNSGRLRDLETRVDRHDVVIQRAGGIGAAFGVLMTLIHLAIDYLRLAR